jgi:aldehyde dehydrogenase (NAD+)/phenylacetaldehyde dehydrogenase
MRDIHQRADKLIRHYRDRVPSLFIGGLAVESDGNATIQISNPATGGAIGRTPAANVRDVERAVEAAKNGHLEWASMSPLQRAKVLWLVADLVEQESEDFAILESLQTGRTFREALHHDVMGAIAVLRHFAGYAGKLPGETHDLGGGVLASTCLEPHPVVGVILSSNAPLATAIRKIAAPLALGSAVVMKPAEQAPFSVVRLAEVMLEAGIPSGTVNVVTGFGGQAGEALAMSPHVSLLAFSGSIETARKITASSAKSNLKEVCFDLGGKSPSLIFPDADPRAAAAAIGSSIFSSVCTANTAASRVLVHEDLYEMIATALANRAREVVIGDPLDEHTEIGPMVSEEHMKRVLAYIELGRREGAKQVAGGKRDVDGTHSEGFFVQPTVFIDVKPSMRVAREEIAGPVLTIMPFTHEEEAVEIANGTDYGLAAAVWTADGARAHRVAQRLKAGVVWVNQYGRIDPAVPFGGVDLSGHGRDLGRAGIAQYSRVKAVYVSSR